MRLATWNVNSAKAREPRLLGWLDEREPDVVCLQETKLSDEAFDESFGAPLAERGYAVAHHGEGRWNGVALLSRVGLDDVTDGLPGAPGYPHQEARAVTATCVCGAEQQLVLTQQQRSGSRGGPTSGFGAG